LLPREFFRVEHECLGVHIEGLAISGLDRKYDDGYVFIRLTVLGINLLV